MSDSLEDVDKLFRKVKVTQEQPSGKGLLGSKSSKSKILWEDMVAVLKKDFDAKDEDLEVLKPTLIFNGSTSKAAFERLNDQMGPIKREGKAKAGEWTLSAIANLYRNEYFHGFLSGAAAQSKLSNLPNGSWLARFSSQSPKCIAFSMLSGENAVEHWVAPFDEDENVYQFEGEDFPSFEAIVERYKNNNLPGSKSKLEEKNIAFCLEGKITLGAKLGGGAFGEVFRASWYRPHGKTQDVAAKKLGTAPVAAPEKKKEDEDDDIPEEKPISLPPDVEAESNLLKKMQHENVVRFFGMVFLNEVPFIVTEICNGGSLLGFLEDIDKMKTTPLSILRMCKEAAKGMEYLSGMDVVHRDLAARNLLVTDKTADATVKVTDFGLSRSIGSAYYVKTGKTGDPVRWAAPESFKPQPGKDVPFKGRVSTRSDRWSFGVLLNEVFNFGQEPYAGYSNSEIRGFLSERQKMSVYLHLDDAPAGVNELIRVCTKYNSHKRPDFTKIVSDLELIEKMLKADPSKNVWEHPEKVAPSKGVAIGRSQYDEDDIEGPEDDADAKPTNLYDDPSAQEHYEESAI